MVTFITNFQYQESEKRLPLDKKMEFINQSLHNNQSLEIIYLQANNEKSTRVITPSHVGEMRYQNQPYLGMKGFCHNSQEHKVFRVDRILEMKEKLA